jgi:hypothetical protein
MKNGDLYLSESARMVYIILEYAPVSPTLPGYASVPKPTVWIAQCIASAGREYPIGYTLAADSVISNDNFRCIGNLGILTAKAIAT